MQTTDHKLRGKRSTEVVPTAVRLALNISSFQFRSAFGFSSSTLSLSAGKNEQFPPVTLNFDLWPSLTYGLDLDMAKMNRRVKFIYAPPIHA